MATKKRLSSGVSLDPDESESQADDVHSFTDGDLGFGHGLKPGAVSYVPGAGEADVDVFAGGDGVRDLGLGLGLQSLNRIFSVDGEEFTTLRRHSAPQISPDGVHNHQQAQAEQSDECFHGNHHPRPRSRTGFLEGLRAFMLRSATLRHFLANSGSGSGDGGNGMWTREHQNDLCIQLEAATQEVNVLQSELEAARKQLDSKYRAIKILQSQAVMINKEKTKSVQQAGSMKKSLEHEVNSLQFDLSTSQECAMLSQQTWADRFNRVCVENETLIATLRARSEQVRRTQLEKHALMRERDELLAMMDAKEHLQYDRHKSSTSDAYLHNSLAQQFGVLGACLCRGSKPEPCGCAKAAARLKKENDLLKDEVDELRQNLEAVTLKADSFTKAFDHQLDQNSLLCQQIQRLCHDEKKSQRRDKSISGRKNRGTQNGCIERNDNYRSGSVRTDDSSDQFTSSDTSASCRSVAVQVSQPLPDLIGTLADLLNDKTEALAHQRLVAKMLARKTQELEKTMKQLSEYNQR
ncbi:coiled-coil domain-containing protein 125-like [Patiria miniata]|uniref:Coiled-coil domain-containing protein 125 n=1 Tax=Patiria miniata TaxID=46514 RepID=A0A914B3E5_PATMI|nr:coiled-coil domain-containing protein 125-like [Patiria miniata]